MEKSRFRCWTRALPLFLGMALLCCDQKPAQESEAVRFDRIARTVFREVYPGLAEQILSDFGISKGRCLDIGCGPAYLSIELARRTDLLLFGIDLDSEAVAVARRNVDKAGFRDRITIEQGDVHQMRFETNSMDLIVSRGSFPFWDDRVTAFKEIHRVLKPGGVAFIGGGMGRAVSPEKKEAIKKQLSEAGMLPGCKPAVTPYMMEETLGLAGIPFYRIYGDGLGDSGCRCGMWVEIRKRDSNRESRKEDA